MAQDLEGEVSSTPIDPSQTEEDLKNLLRGLIQLGVNFNEASVGIHYLPDEDVIWDDEESGVDSDEMIEKGYFLIHTSTDSIESPHAPFVERNFMRDTSTELIKDFTAVVSTSSNYLIRASGNKHDDPFRMFIFAVPEDENPYRLTLAMPLLLNNQEPMLLGSLNPYFTFVHMNYDLSGNPDYKEVLSPLSQIRVPADVYTKIPRSIVNGMARQDGIEATIHLNLQDPNPENHLECYEIELFPIWNPEEDHTIEVVPESFWQEDERHYCMTDKLGSYPLIPIEKIERLSKLRVDVNYHGDSPEVMFDSLHDLPLSIDASEQWYANGPLGEGQLELMFKPEWGEDNAALVYTHDSTEKFTSHQIHEVLQKMITVKTTLVERYAP